MGSDNVIAFDFAKKERIELPAQEPVDPLQEATARLEQQLLEEAKDAQREAELCSRSNPELARVEAWHAGLEAQIAKARKILYESARYNFILRTDAEQKGPRVLEETVFLEQLNPLMPTDERFRQERLHLNTFLLFDNEEMIEQFYEPKSKSLYRMSHDGKIFLTPHKQVKIVLANIREIIRMFEKQADASVSIQGIDYASKFFTTDAETGVNQPAILLPSTYRSNTRVEHPIKSLLDLFLVDTTPTVSYRFK